MKALLIGMAILSLAACGEKDKQPPSPLPADTAASQDHAVQSKIEPDTLIDEQGNFCVVTVQQYERVAVGGPFRDCVWSARPTSLNQEGDMELHSRTMIVRAVEEFDADNNRISLREQQPAGQPGAPPMAGGGGGAFSFNIARADSPEVLAEVTVTVSSAP